MRTRYSRRILWLGAFVVLLFGGYSAGWLYFADLLRKQTSAAIARMNTGEVSAECAAPAVRGYPFRLGVWCDGVAFSDASRGIHVTAGGFRSAGQVYDLTHLVAELDGPASIDLPDAAPLALDWRRLRASVRLATPLPERLSVESTALTASLQSGAPLASLASFEAHMRPNAGDLDLAARFEGLEFAGEAAVDEACGALRPGRPLRHRRRRPGGIGRRKPARPVGHDAVAGAVERAGHRLALSGPFSIGADGLLDADLQLTVRDPAGLSTTLGNAFPEARQQIAASLSGLSALGPEPSLPLKIVKGKATLGFIPLGDVPPL